ncbi:MAG: tRNA (guanosine(46)-N7)-methyltransferase TrmB [bacterium]|nr:tRNA (guanosine(46)-N7)-methyltransferase TrmB [bacterium]
MRMRRKKNLGQRLEGCGEYLITLPRRNLDSRCDEAVDLLDCHKIFDNNNEIQIEIGCGKGRFITGIAKKNPQINFFAIEKSDNVIVEACEKAINAGIRNVRFLNIGAEYLLRYFPRHSVGRIYLNFSCPYPKKGYANHRLTNPKFLEIYKQILKSDGEIHQKTDNQGLFEYSIENLTCCGFKLKNISLDLHNSGFENNTITEYEEKFAGLGKNIYRLEAFLQ